MGQEQQQQDEEGTKQSSIFVPPELTRLVTIAAHVDHGKTTLADSLIASNGLISERAAGTLRYLDSDPEEQRRGITMRSSAIGLKHTVVSKKGPQKSMIVHLVDSPGHTDFAREVSSSLIGCDSAILVVDAVEGMGARTSQVVREAAQYELTPVLLINKLDRLCTELCLTPIEAYLRLRTLLENINAAASAMITSAGHQKDYSEEEMAHQEKLWIFEPGYGNVVFASALHGWGFTVPGLCRSLFRSGAVPIKPPMLRPFLFGDFKLKGDKVLKCKQQASSEDDLPLFAKYALAPIWEMYHSIATAAAVSNQTRITSTSVGMDQVLNAMQTGGTSETASPSTASELQEIMTHTGAGSSEESTLRALLRRYRPLAATVLDVICESCPSPATASSTTRIQALSLRLPSNGVDSAYKALAESVKLCDASPTAPAVAYVSKFLSTDKFHVRDDKLPVVDGDNNLILGVGRVLSGRIRSGKSYFVFGANQSENPVQKCTIRLYLLMGSSFVRVDEVPAGHLCAIYGLEETQLKTATISDCESCQPLRGYSESVQPLVKVNIEPLHVADNDFLEAGLAKLRMADAAVEIQTTEKGERMLSCLGELHLEQSILDLEKVYCGKEGMKIRVSDPIVEFAETTTWFDGLETTNFSAFANSDAPRLRQLSIPPYNEEEGVENAKHGRMRSVLSGRVAAISLRVVPLAKSIWSALKEDGDGAGCHDDMRTLATALGLTSEDDPMSLDSVKASFEALQTALCAVDICGNAMITSSGVSSGECIRGVDAKEVFVQTDKIDSDKIDSDDVDRDEYTSIQKAIRNPCTKREKRDLDTAAEKIWHSSMKAAVSAGFDLAVRSGPICEESIKHVLVVIEAVEVAICREENDKLQESKLLSGGMVVSAVRSGIRCALLSRPARLMEGHLRLTLHASLSGLGPLYSVLSKRRGKVIEDSMVDGTDLLMITASIPQAESFGLTPVLFAKTSGEVTAPEMVFSHWDCLDVDPFWIPTSDEEREDYGELLTSGDLSTGLDNTALSYIRAVRRRKGLTVDSSRTIVNSEKQRTMKK